MKTFLNRIILTHCHLQMYISSTGPLIRDWTSRFISEGEIFTLQKPAAFQTLSKTAVIKTQTFFSWTTIYFQKMFFHSTHWLRWLAVWSDDLLPFNTEALSPLTCRLTVCLLSTVAGGKCFTSRYLYFSSFATLATESIKASTKVLSRRQHHSNCVQYEKALNGSDNIRKAVIADSFGTSALLKWHFKSRYGTHYRLG